MSEIQWYIPAGLQPKKHHSATFLIQTTALWVLEMAQQELQRQYSSRCANLRKHKANCPHTATGNDRNWKPQSWKGTDWQHLSSLWSKDPFSYSAFCSAGARALFLTRCDTTDQLMDGTLSCPDSQEVWRHTFLSFSFLTLSHSSHFWQLKWHNHDQTKTKCVLLNVTRTRKILYLQFNSWAAKVTIQDYGINYT